MTNLLHRPHYLELHLNQLFLQFAAYYGFVPRVCRPVSYKMSLEVGWFLTQGEPGGAVTACLAKTMVARPEYVAIQWRFQALPLVNRQALTITHNRDGERLRLPERLLLSVCRPVEAQPLAVTTVTYTLDNALGFATRTIPGFLERIQGKTVLDYGCGPGWQAVAMRRAGARRVVGLDINDAWLSHGRDLAARAGVDGVTFTRTPDTERYDIVLSLGAMEHFDDPGEHLTRMCSMTGQELLVSFAEPWHSPYGTHLGGTTRLPWLNLWFSERTLLNVRNLYPDGSDGARRFEEIRGGLNKMTVRRFEKLVAAIPEMRVEYLSLHSVKRVPFVTRVPVLRELMTGALTCILKPAVKA